MSNEQDILTINFSELHERLKTRGVEISTGALSEFIASGDVQQILGGVKKGRSKLFPVGTVDILAAFLPEFRAEEGAQWTLAPKLLRVFVKQGSMELTASSASSALVRESPKNLPPAIEAAREQGRAQGLAEGDDLLNEKEAAELCGCSVRLFRTSVAPRIPPRFRIGKLRSGDRWRKSDLLSF